MRKKAIIIANTVFQLIVAIQMKLTVLKNIDVDLLISDHSVGADKYVKSGRQTGIFQEVKAITTLSYTSRIEQYKEENVISEISYSFGRYWEVFKRLGILRKYDYIYSANMDNFAIALYDTVKVFYNGNVKIYLFEDGLSTYKVEEAIILRKKSDLVNGRYKKIYELAKYGMDIEKISGVFLFNPKMFSWKNKIKKYKIPKINKNDSKTLQVFNEFFDYKSINNYKLQKVKVIFFEESFYADGYRTNDINLVKLISDCIGKDNLLIKLHPRNQKNRFKDYNTFDEIGIPWEIFYMNNGFSNLVWVSISSGCVIHPFILFGDNKEMIILQEIANLQLSGIQKIYQAFLKTEVFSKHPEIFHMIKDKTELKDYFKTKTALWNINSNKT